MEEANSLKELARSQIKSLLALSISKYKTPTGMKASDEYKQRSGYEAKWKKTERKLENSEKLKREMSKTVLITARSLNLFRTNKVQ